MKRSWFLILFLLLFAFPKEDKASKIIPFTDVYICLSKTAYAYHNNRNCRGLGNCTHKIETVRESVGRSTYRRKPCGYCY